MLLGLVLATSGSIEVLGEPMPRGRARGAAAGRRAGRGAGGLPAPVRAAQPRALRRDRAGRRIARDPQARGSRRRWSGSGWPAWTTGRSAPTRSACASGSAWPAPCCADRGCWSSTSRPTASTRRASTRSASCCSSSTATGTTVFLSSHLLAEIEQMCTRVGVLDRGRLVLQDELAELRGPTGRVEVRHARRRRAVARAARRRGRGVTTTERLLVRDGRPGRAQRQAGRRPASG